MDNSRPLAERRRRPPGALSPPSKRRVITAAIASWTLMAVVTLGITPVYPNIAHSLGLEAGSFGALIGISTLVAGILQVPMGYVADRFPLRYLCAAGLVASAAAPAVWGLAPNYRVYALGLVCMGICIVCLQAGFHTAVTKAFNVSRRSTALSMLWVATSLGSIASLLIFGQLGGHFGWRPVTLGVCWVPLLALPLVLRMPDAGPARTTRSVAQIGRGSLAFLRHKGALGISGLMLLAAGVSTATQFLIPFVLRRHSVGVATTGLLLVPYIAGGLVGSPFMGALADRFGPARPMGYGAALGGTAMVAVALTGLDPAVLVAAFFVQGALANGGGAVLISSVAGLASGTDGVGIGLALGICRLAQSVGSAVAPSLIGYTFLIGGSVIAELALAAVLAVSAGLAFTVLVNLEPVAVHTPVTAV